MLTEWLVKRFGELSEYARNNKDKLQLNRFKTAMLDYYCKTNPKPYLFFTPSPSPEGMFIVWPDGYKSMTVCLETMIAKLICYNNDELGLTHGHDFDLTTAEGWDYLNSELATNLKEQMVQ